MNAPIRSRSDQLVDALTEAAIRYADAAAEDEAAFREGKTMLIDAAKAFGRRAHHHTIKEGLWRRKAAGLPVGRPPKLTRAQAEFYVRLHGSKRAAAQALGVDRRTLRNALGRNSTFLPNRKKGG